VARSPGKVRLLSFPSEGAAQKFGKQALGRLKAILVRKAPDLPTDVET
jgi:hypothetical protein